MKVLIACEESQAVTIKMREIGLEAYSCDLERCTGGHPEWHIKADVTTLLNENWNMIIAFPPCTHLCVSGATWFEIKRKDGRQKQGIDFFKRFVTLKCKRVAIENPIGIMSRVYREPDQIIQPYQFGDSFQKTTCLWLKNLPKLKPTKIVDPGEFVIAKSGRKRSKWLHDFVPSDPKECSKFRSRTFNGIAQAMADQWGKGLLNGTLNYIQQSLF